MNALISSLTEAWEELVINRRRVILSLIGVGAAVWAMATVLALGSIVTSGIEAWSAVFAGRPGTVTVGVGGAETPAEQPNNMVFAEPEQTGPVGTRLSDGEVEDAFGTAALKVAQTTQSNYWSRKRSVSMKLQAPGIQDCYNPFAGQGAYENSCFGGDPQVIAIDPGYFTIYYKRSIAGRLLNDSDGQLQMNPAVINESLWQMMGKPDISQYPRVRLEQYQDTVYTVVGVVANATTYDTPELYLHYDSFMASSPKEMLKQAAYSNYIFLAPPGEEKQARDVVVSALAGQLGPSYSVDGYFDERQNEGQAQQLTAITAVISLIGGIVILLGALGLLTVSIVTIQQRVREIGIRRAMGASARRVFFSVFLESVVATTVAGVFGVVASIVTIRTMPLEWLDLPVTSSAIPYPMSAAFIGVLISAFVGALCGIIPAIYAVQIKPIDAIRY